MLRALTTAATGMIAQQNYLDVIANNVSNVNTTAFKKSRIEFQDLLSQAARTPGALMNQGTYQPVEGGYKSTVYVNHGQKKVWLGELILQLERLADDLPLMVGEYNHCLPRSYCKDYNLAERFGQDGPVGGEIISHEDNNIHWNLCEKIRKQTGFLVSFMMGDPNTAPIKVTSEFNRNMVMGLHEAGILRIIEDLGDPSED